MHLLRLSWILAAVLLAACGGDEKPRTFGGDGGGADAKGKADGGGPGQTITWLTESLDENTAGKHAAIASCGTKIGVAYFRTIDSVQMTCPASFVGGGGTQQRPAQDLYYVQYDGTSWSEPVKVIQTIGTTSGLSLAMDKSCKVYIGYLGGEISQMECASSDAMIASSSDGQSWAQQTVNDRGATGDTVGQWMAVAVDNANAVHSIYRDVHYGLYEEDGNIKSSLYYDTEEMKPVAAGNGAGIYTTLRFDKNNGPVAAYFNGPASTIQLAIQSGGAWTSTQVARSATEERLSLDVNQDGLFGLAYYDSVKRVLYYSEASKLDTWSQGVQVDHSLTTHGQFGSLAFDPTNGNPAISYYRCGDYGKTACDVTKDGLMFAYRRGGTWKTYTVDEGSTNACGRYTALAFTSSGTPIIAYQCVSYDNTKGNWIETLKVAKGVYK